MTLMGTKYEQAPNLSLAPSQSDRGPCGRQACERAHLVCAGQAGMGSCELDVRLGFEWVGMKP